MHRNARQDVLEIGKRINFVQLASSNKTAQYCRSLSAIVAAQESPVGAPNSYPANAPFGIVVVDFQIAVLAKAVERYPVLEHIPHSPARRALWQQLCLNLQ